MDSEVSETLNFKLTESQLSRRWPDTLEREKEILSSGGDHVRGKNANGKKMSVTSVVKNQNVNGKNNNSKIKKINE